MSSSFYSLMRIRLNADRDKGLISEDQYYEELHNLNEICTSFHKDNLKDDEEGDTFR